MSRLFNVNALSNRAFVKSVIRESVISFLFIHFIIHKGHDLFEMYLFFFLLSLSVLPDLPPYETICRAFILWITWLDQLISFAIYLYFYSPCSSPSIRSVPIWSFSLLATLQKYWRILFKYNADNLMVTFN